MKYIGIWLDKEKAHLFTLHQGKESFITIQSDVEFYHPRGGSRSKSKWGPQDVVQDSKYTEREKHQLKSFFGDIAKAIKAPRSIAIFGPGTTYSQFFKWLEENHRNLAQKVGPVQKTDSMTDNQFKALVRDVFGMSPDRSQF